MMPADLIYALSSERQRAAGRARADRIALHESTRARARERREAVRAAHPAPPARPRWVRVRVRRTRTCTP
jgi:hypothetical protein